MDATTADFNLRDVEFGGNTLDVHVQLVIPSVGDLGCPTNSNGAPGLVVLQGSFSAGQLFAGQPLVLMTPADAPVQMRITIAGTWQLGGVELSSD